MTLQKTTHVLVLDPALTHYITPSKIYVGVVPNTKTIHDRKQHMLLVLDPPLKTHITENSNMPPVLNPTLKHHIT